MDKFGIILQLRKQHKYISFKITDAINDEESEMHTFTELAKI